MKVYAAVLVLAILLHACKDSADTLYRGYEKWQTDSWSSRQLTGSPKEIKETSYTQLTDTSFQPPSKLNDYRVIRFDSAGNIVYMLTWIDSAFFAEMHATHQPEGLRTRFLSFDKPGGTPVSETRRVAEKIGKGKYKVTTIKDSINTYENIETYSDNGETISVECWQNGQQLWTTTNKYEKSLLLSSKKSSRGEDREMIYHYSPKGFLDSVITIGENKSSTTQVNINNEYGDPLEVKDGDRLYRFRYEYDAKGNWVKRLMFDSHPMINLDSPDGSKFKNYSLTIRDIKY